MEIKENEMSKFTIDGTGETELTFWRINWIFLDSNEYKEV